MEYIAKQILAIVMLIFGLIQIELPPWSIETGTTWIVGAIIISWMPPRKKQ